MKISNFKKLLIQCHTEQNSIYPYPSKIRIITSKEKTETEKKDLFREILYNGVHGFCFSLYEDGQKPGDIISEEQVRRRMEILKPHTSWVRSFSCTEGNEHIPKIAKEFGMKTLVGAWLGDDPEINEREVEGLIKLAKEGFVDIAAVGNEVMYRKDLTEDELLEFINRVKKEIPEISVGYVDAYYEFTIKPRITEACDVILANCYPFWESCPAENSLNYMKQMYYQAKQAANGKTCHHFRNRLAKQRRRTKRRFSIRKKCTGLFHQHPIVVYGRGNRLFLLFLLR